MNVIIEVTATESFGNCSASRTVQIQVPSLLLIQDDQGKGSANFGEQEGEIDKRASECDVLV